MEQSMGYKVAKCKLQEMEQLNNTLKVELGQNAFKKAKESMEREIEYHFAKCMNALIARKTLLLKELEQKTNAEVENVHANQKHLDSLIEAGKQVINSASMMYNADPCYAEMVWKGMTTVVLPHCNHRLALELPITLLESIEAHGKDSISTLMGKTKHYCECEDEYDDDSDMSLDALAHPGSIHFNPRDECLYVCNDHQILQISMHRQVSVCAYIENNRPFEFAVQHSDNTIYFTNLDSNCILKNALGTIIMVAGNEKEGYVNGVAQMARFWGPEGLALDQETGTLFVSDSGNHVIRKISPDGEVSTLAGTQEGYEDGMEAKFSCPGALCFDAKSQSLIVCDYNNNKLRRVRLNGEVSTVCEIETPASVAVSANQTIFAVSETQLYKLVQKVGGGYETTIVAKMCGFNRGIAIHEAANTVFVCTDESITKFSFKD